MVIVVGPKNIQKANSKEERLSVQDEKRLNSCIPGVSTQQVTNILSVLHTNPDCRYGALKLKRLSAAMGYYPNHHVNEIDSGSDVAEKNEREPKFYKHLIKLCMQFLLKTSTQLESMLVSGNVKTPIEVKMMESNQLEQCVLADGELYSDLEEMNNQLQMHTDYVLPSFFSGSLSEVSKSVQRGSQCSWPPFLLLLYHQHSRANERFIREVLCASGLNESILQIIGLQAGDEASVSAQIQSAQLHTSNVNTILIERGIKLVPWNCSVASNRTTLGLAFKGTRLEQWMQKLQKDSDYPLLIAVGRTSLATVVCSKLTAKNYNLNSTLQWLEAVTRAHFTDYQKEESETKFERFPKEDSVNCANGQGECRICDTSNDFKKMKTSICPEVIFESYVSETAKSNRVRSKEVFLSYKKIKSIKINLNQLLANNSNRKASQRNQSQSTLIGQKQASSDSKCMSIQNEVGQKDWIKKISLGTSIPPDVFTIPRQQEEAILDFTARFLDKFTNGLPVTPMLLFSRFSTAVARCLNPLTGEQHKPLLIYLHDDNAAGTPHFVANILCSQRFNNRLYDDDVMIWPFDLTEHKDAQARPKNRINDQCKKGEILKLNNVRVSSWSRILQPKRTSSVDSNRRSISPETTSRKSVFQGLSTSTNRKISTTLLELFRNHPAKEILAQIISKRFVPVLLNLRIQNKMFEVNSALASNATTKEAVTWISQVMHDADPKSADLLYHYEDSDESTATV